MSESLTAGDGPNSFGHIFLPLSHIGERRPLRFLRYLGQTSLLIYLVHQPVLVGLFLLLGIGEWPSGLAETSP